MTGGEAYRANILTDDALDAAISAYLADPTGPVMLKVGGNQLDVAAAVLAHKWSVEELAVENASAARRRNAVRTAILLSPV